MLSCLIIECIRCFGVMATKTKLYSNTVLYLYTNQFHFDQLASSLPDVNVAVKLIF